MLELLNGSLIFILHKALGENELSQMYLDKPVDEEKQNEGNDINIGTVCLI